MKLNQKNEEANTSVEENQVLGDNMQTLNEPQPHMKCRMIAGVTYTFN